MTEENNQNNSAAQRLLENLKSSDAFKEFIQDQPQAICSHFFMQINEDFAAMSQWDIGYYNPVTEKVTVFTLNDAGSFIVKAADDVFSQGKAKVEELKLTEKTKDFTDIIPYANEIIETEFEDVKNLRGSGFTILQTIGGQTVWNLSFITKKLTFLNLKLDAETGEKITGSNESAIVPGAN